MSDLMLKQFEAWAVTDYKYSITRFYTDLRYDDDDTEAAWDAWQASREFMVIDLEPDDPADEGAAYLHQDFVKERIQSLGLKVKP